MDPASLTAFLAPFLPYLLKGVQTLTEEAGGALGHEAWEAAKRLWAKLRPKVEEKAAAAEAATALATNADDELARNALAFQLRELLASDPDLKAELERLWRETEPARIAVAGDRGVATAGNLTNSTIVTGDHVDTRG